ncbi:MAG TPA: S-methyl-5'-thioadenosine phosphorylase, partial [Armatimonadetes bacterium]|nr:S-methyl-5'-thioadenosine phosphorylase [Armatimonadota bacterium]
MVKADAALIGGTGIGEILRAHPGRAVMVPTPFGPMRGWLQDRQGQRVIVVARHAAGHKTPPHGIGYRAMAEGLRLMGVRRCLATAAVGSLRVDWAPGTLAVVTDFIDATGRQVTGV